MMPGILFSNAEVVAVNVLVLSRQDYFIGGTIPIDGREFLCFWRIRLAEQWLAICDPQPDYMR
jgi:hypothetical protein